ncbi:penicillin acylase family protein [Actinoplanes sp. NPDC049802]|uniref:penicillin acylase family protein n=1 Tax=Actinoplanes sp. NPDC049802 TaxID=3154742 RepID=UPI00340B9D00
MTWCERALRLLALPSLHAQRARGRVRAHGLHSGADIRRDARGVPFVTAADERDLYFAAGYAQATDRLWQMDVLRRRARGRLAEIFGPAVLADDIRARQLGLDRVARRSEDLLDPASRDNLTAFSAGIDAAVRRMRRRAGLPLEFRLLRYRPEPWTPGDSIIIVKHLGFDLGRNLAEELFRIRLAREHPESVTAFGAPKYPAGGAVTVRTAVPGRAPAARPATPAPADLPAASRVWLDTLLSGEHPTGSNAWAVSGTRTASGHPVLANDPHVVATQPSLWYQMGLRLESDGTTAYGVTVPGLPGLIAGANQRLAWGITNATVDTQDVCVLGGTSGPSWTEDGVIAVRGADPVPVRAAGGERHVELSVPGAEEPHRYGLFWSGLQPSVEITACQRMWRATDYPGFRDELRAFGVPVLNVVVAVADGTIALRTAGNVPARVPGSSGDVAPEFIRAARSWQGFVGFDDLPETVDPPEGYIVSANHRLLPTGAALDVGVDWQPPYRAERIEELITTASAITAPECARWQSDLRNGRARRVLPTLLAALRQQPPETAVAAECHRLLADWDGHDHGHAAAPLVFFRLMQALARHWIGGPLGEDLAAAMPDAALQVDHLVLAADDREPLPVVACRALTEAARQIAAECGDDPSLWRWDTVHRIHDQHPLARAIPALARLFGAPPTPVGGSSHTVCLTSAEPGGRVVDVAPWRFVAELSPSGPRVWDVLRHGASGNPVSPHYGDQTPDHTGGRHHEVDPRGPAGGRTERLRAR